LLESLGQTRNRADATARRAELAAQREEELVNEVAHEVRRPLQPLKTRAELLLLLMARGQRPTDQELKDFLVASTHRVDQAARVLRRLMEAARLEEGKMVLDRRLTNVAAIVSEIVEGARLIDRRHNFTLIAPAVAEARVDPTAIDQVIANLVENAIKFSPRGTEIQVEILDDADGVQIEVRDSGPGVALERRATLFARGTQANGSGQGGGLGLGLYISSRIVEMHGGTIQAIFPDSGGSRFCVWLPKLPSDSTRQTTV
jgi:signal transduction histidine kinase